MDDESDQSHHARDAEYLRGNAGFSGLPPRFRELVLKSSHASADFASFYLNGGRIVGDPNEALASYRSEPQREIRINQKQYEFAKTPGGAHLVDGIFSTIAHEIGHDKDRGARFQHGTAEEYVQFRSEKEAKAIFNAFPIFADLKKSEPSFDPVWGNLGYSPMGMAWPGLYDKWRDGSLSDTQVVKEMAKPVADFPYTRSDGLIDHSGDGRLTQRDRYLEDYRRVLRSDRNVDGDAEPGQTKEKTGSGEPMSPHPLLNGLNGKVHDALARDGAVLADTQVESATLSLAVQSARAGLRCVDHVVVGHAIAATGERNLFAVQGDLRFPGHLRTHLPLTEALATPPKESLQSLAAAQTQESPSLAVQQSELQRPPLSRG